MVKLKTLVQNEKKSQIWAWHMRPVWFCSRCLLAFCSQTARPWKPILIRLMVIGPFECLDKHIMVCQPPTPTFFLKGRSLIGNPEARVGTLVPMPAARKFSQSWTPFRSACPNGQLESSTEQSNQGVFSHEAKGYPYPSPLPGDDRSHAHPTQLSPSTLWWGAQKTHWSWTGTLKWEHTVCRSFCGICLFVFIPSLLPSFLPSFLQFFVTSFPSLFFSSHFDLPLPITVSPWPIVSVKKSTRKERTSNRLANILWHATEFIIWRKMARLKSILRMKPRPWRTWRRSSSCSRSIYICTVCSRVLRLGSRPRVARRSFLESRMRIGKLG